MPTELMENQPIDEAIPTKRVGAKPGNTNGLRSGLKVGVHKRVVLGRLPKGCRSIRGYTNALTERLVDLLTKAKGGVSPLDALIVDEVVRWEQHYLLAARWLRLNFAEMTPGERLQHSKEMAKATHERNKCIRTLNLDAQDFASEALYGSQPYSLTEPQNPTQRKLGA